MSFVRSARFAVRSKLSNCVPFQAGDFGFIVDCVAQCENVLSIDQAQLDLATGPIGVLDNTALGNVIKAIGYVIKMETVITLLLVVVSLVFLGVAVDATRHPK
ncbi:MAG: hypothetical protein ACRERD_28805 [Candidatus Binatia bacterium]